MYKQEIYTVSKYEIHWTFLFLYFKMQFINETCKFSSQLNQDAVKNLVLHYSLRYGWKSIDWGRNEWYKS